MKFIHEGHIITIQSDKDVVTFSEPVLQINHNKDNLHLIEFVFDEVQVVSLEDDDRDMIPMSFDYHSNTLLLTMIKGMSYIPGLRLGRRQQGSREFSFTIDHDIPHGLGYTPSEGDARHMAMLHRDRVKACLSEVPFDFPLRQCNPHRRS